MLGDLAGRMTEVTPGSYGSRGPADFLPQIADTVAATTRRSSGRVRVVVAVVAGTVSGTRLLQFATRGWNEADLGVLTSKLPPRSGVRLLAGNDATLGGLAEARSGAARTAGVALHILVAEGVGGVLLVDGQPTTGTRGAGGEYGHLPFGDPALAVPLRGTRLLGSHGRRASTRSSPWRRPTQRSHRVRGAAPAPPPVGSSRLILGISEPRNSPRTRWAPG